MRTQWMPMIVDSKYESNTWRIMAIDMWQRSRRNPTTKNDTSSKYLNLIHILCYAMSNESEARIRLLASKDAAATWVLQISMLSMQQPFFGVSSRSSQEYKYKRQVKEHASMLSGEVAFTSDIEIRYNVQRATWTMMMVTASSHYIEVQFLPLQWINLQLVTYHMFFVSKRANSYVLYSVHILCALSMKQYRSNLVSSSFHKQKRYIR